MYFYKNILWIMYVNRGYNTTAIQDGDLWTLSWSPDPFIYSLTSSAVNCNNKTDTAPCFAQVQAVPAHLESFQEE